MTGLLLFAPAMAGVVMLGLAAWLIWHSPERLPARVFSFLLTVRGISLIALTAIPTATTPTLMRLAHWMYPSLCLVAVAAVLYFVSMYPAPRWGLPRGPLTPLVFFGPPVLLALAALRWPDLGIEGLPSEPGLPAAVAHLMSARRGPLGVANTLLDLSMAVPAFVLIRDYLASDPGRRRSTLLLISLGFFAPAACSCLMAGAFLQIRGGLPRPSDPSVFNFIEMGLFAAWALIMTGLLAYLVAKAIREPEPAKRRAAALFLGIMVLSTGIGAGAALLPDPLDAAVAILVMVAFWSVVGAGIVTYAVIRHSLFDIDLRFKRTLERGTVAASFVVVYFVVSESAAQLLGDFAGSAYVGIGAAALLLLALRPLERLASRLTTRTMPGVRPFDDLERSERESFYREHVALLWMDGSLSAKDRMVMASLRSRLGLEPEVAERIELDVLSADPTAKVPEV